MSEIYLKARVLLLDVRTGETIGECEIVSDSKEIFYNNKKPLMKAIGEYPAGTTFDKESLATILDNILYTKYNPSVDTIRSSNGDIYDIEDDIEIIKPKGSQVDDFTLSGVVKFGSYDNITVNLYEYSDNTDKVVVGSIELEKFQDIDYATISFEVSSFDTDTDLWIEIDTGNEVIIGKKISYKFISPIWIGWITPDTINNIGELDKSVTEDYFQELIDHDFKTLEKRFVTKSNQSQFVDNYITYDTRENLNPCIIVPQTWGELKKIVDTNGVNITNLFAHKIGLDINTHGIYIEHYIAYVCRHTFADDNKLAKGITYIWDGIDQDINMANIAGNGIPILTGFSVQYAAPIDDRFYCKTYGDLLTMKYPYPGLQTYVEDINTTFRFERGHWVPFNNKLHVIESLDELTEDLGGWDDLAINAMDSKIWKKRYNNQWERYGDIKAEDGNVTLNLAKEENTDVSSNNQISIL